MAAGIRRGLLLLFFPADKELFLGQAGSVKEALRVVSGKEQLGSYEEIRIVLLVGDELADTVAHVDGRTLKLDDAHGETVKVQHEIRAPYVAALVKSDFFSNGEVVVFRVLPVDEMHRFIGLAHSRGDLYAVPEKFIHPAVCFIE